MKSRKLDRFQSWNKTEDTDQSNMGAEMLAIGRKEVVLEKEDQSLLAEDRRREGGGGTLPFLVLAL